MKGKVPTSYENDEERHDAKIQARRAIHESQRDKDLADMKKYYADHKEYFRRKNREHYAKNKEKWASARRRTKDLWDLRNCPKTTADGIFEEFGLGITIEEKGRISIHKIFALLEAFGYDLDSHHDYPPYEKRYRAFIDEYRTLQDMQNLDS